MFRGPMSLSERSQFFNMNNCACSSRGSSSQGDAAGKPSSYVS
jgi:hypothetical protein